MANVPNSRQLQDDPFGFRDPYREDAKPQPQPFKDAAFPSWGEYTRQVDQYDAGRPTTMSERKLGNQIVPRGGQVFDPSVDHKMNSLAQVQPTRTITAPQNTSAPDTMGYVPLEQRGMWNPRSQFARDVNTGVGAVRDVGNKITDKIDSTISGVGRYFTADAANPGASASTPLPATPVKFAGGDSSNNPASPIAPDPVAPQNAWKDGVNTVAGGVPGQTNVKFAADKLGGQGIWKDPETGKISIRLTGDEGNKFMANRMMTARPSGMLSVTPASTGTAPARTIGEYSGMFTGDSQPNELARANEALRKRQIDVYNAERNDPTLLTAPGTNSYIDPSLAPEQQRARQSEIDLQERANRQAVLDRTVAENATNNAVLASKGLPTRKIDTQAVDISTQGAERKLKADVASAEQTGATQRTMMTDETQRRGQDMELANRDAQRAADAEQGTANRKAQIEAAKITADARPQKETQAEKTRNEAIKSFFSALGKIRELGQEPTPEQIKALLDERGLKPTDISGPATPPPLPTV